MVARLEREGLGHLLGREFDAAKAEAARRFPNEAVAVEPETARPPLVLASTAAPPATTLPVMGRPGAALRDAAIATGRRAAARELTRLGPGLLAGTAGLTAALAAVLLIATTVPAGDRPITLEQPLDDGRTVRFTFNPAERLGALTIAAPSGEAVRLTLQRAEQGGFVFTDGVVSAGDAPTVSLSRAELAAVVDTVAPAFAKQGVRIDIGGEDDGEGGRDGSSPPGSREHRAHNNPPDLVSDGDDQNDQEPDPGRHPVIVAAAALITTFAINKFGFNRNYHIEDVREATEATAEELLGPEPEGFDPEAIKQGLDAMKPDIEARLQEIQNARDVFNATPEEITGAEGLGGRPFENYLRKTYGGRGNFRARHQNIDREIDGELPDGTWYEAKGAGAWQKMLESPSKLLRVQEQLLNQKSMAKRLNKGHVLITNGTIPRSIRLWLRENGIRFIELIKVK